MDVPRLLETLRAASRKFFPTYLYLVTKCLNQQQEFKIAYQEKVLGYYDTLTPLYASFHEDDKTFSLMWTEYDADYEVFYQNYLYNQRRYGENHGVLSQPQTPPPPQRLHRFLHSLGFLQAFRGALLRLQALFFPLGGGRENLHRCAESEAASPFHYLPSCHYRRVPCGLFFESPPAGNGQLRTQNQITRKG